MITEGIRIILNIANWLFGHKKESADDIRLCEDAELADAIKRGDSETVNAIRERRRRYPNSTIMLLVGVGLFLSGCTITTDTRRTIPLASGDAPYQLPVGEYVDTKGILHIENTNRWSLSEQDLFNKSNPEVLKPKSKNEGLITKLIYGILGLLIVFIGLIVLRNLGKAMATIWKRYG